MRFVAGGVTAAKGFTAWGMPCGIKKNGVPDLALIYSETPAVAAGVFTTNRVKAAPVLLSQRHLTGKSARAVLINSGNANACVGEEGIIAAETTAKAAAEQLKIKPEEILLGSTGVIGVPLPVERILTALPDLCRSLSATGGPEASRAIMTTDTFPKEWAVEVEEEGYRIGGMAKGSGMIHPNMATMLAVITTDAAVEKDVLQEALRRTVAGTFNRVTVDGDMSTNDTVFIIANGAAGRPTVRSGKGLDIFLAALHEVCLRLAHMIVKDGEGATKFLSVRVSGARNEKEAETAARAVANSNLVKTAFFGEDANWGRILAAVGYSGIDFSPEKTVISLGDLAVYRGKGLSFDEEKAAGILRNPEIEINIDLHQGGFEAVIWTCDLSYDYVKINGSYRT